MARRNLKTPTLTITNMLSLKRAANLVAPDRLTDVEERALQEAVVVLTRLIADRRTSSHDTFVDSLRDSTFAAEQDITAETTVEQLGGLWIAEIEAEERIKVQTVDRYLTVLKTTILPVLGHMQVSELTVGILDRFLKNLIKVHVSQTRSAKVVLNQMLAMAVRHGALAINPVREVGRLRKPRKPVKVLTMADVARVRTAIHDHQTRSRLDGPVPNMNLPDVVDLMLATGARIGEILALRWQDIDLTRGTLTVCGTLIFVKGVGWSRQDWPKSDAGHRTVFLPPFAIEMLLRRRPSVPDNDLDAVFASRNGTWLQPDNLRRSWRQVRQQVGLEWVTPHVFRKTVATLLHEAGRTSEATAQLGHSGEEVTKTYYVAKPTVAPDVSDILERLAPRKSG